jgi:hypothetical protein
MRAADLPKSRRSGVKSTLTVVPALVSLVESTIRCGLAGFIIKNDVIILFMKIVATVFSG